MVKHTIGKAELSSASLLDLCLHDNCSPSHAFSWSHTFFLEGCKGVDESRPQYLRHRLVFLVFKDEIVGPLYIFMDEQLSLMSGKLSLKKPRKCETLKQTKRRFRSWAV